MRRAHLICIAAASLGLAVWSCSADPNSNNVFKPGGTGGDGNAGMGGTIPTAGAGGDQGTGGSMLDGSITPGSDCADSAKKIYLVTEGRQLYSFNPEIDGMAAYSLVGNLGCQATLNPQSMSVDRAGNAYVFYSSGELFKVSTQDASCTPLSGYQHPVGCSGSCMLGMGFTADAPGSAGQILYILSPDFGLATIDIASLAVTKKNVFNGVTGELTGGPDAKLFRFESTNAQLAEVTQNSWETTPIHKFNLSGVTAFAFSRYAGKFYVYTAGSLSKSTTTMYDPVADAEATRDQNIGVIVVGAGQSTCVPPPPPK